MLAFNWDFLNYREKQYFNSDEALFLEKKRLLIENSRITSEMKSLHEKIKLLDEGEKMQHTAEILIELDSQRTKNWKKLDTWQHLKN